MSRSVAFCRRISPRAMAFRSRTGFGETSTMLASPCRLMWLNFFMGADRSTLPRFARAFNLLTPVGDGAAHLFGGVQCRLHKFWCEPRERADEIVRHENLAVAIRARANPDRRNGKLRGQFFRHGRSYNLQHDGERSS